MTEGESTAGADRVRSAYSELAPRYDARTRRMQRLLGYREAAYRRQAIDALELRPGGVVLDIGCGTGLNHAALHDAVGPEGRIFGVDLTAEMLEQAERRAKERGWENVELVESDALSYAPPAGLDGVLATFSLSFIPRCGEVVRRGAAALRQGGRLAVADQKLPRQAQGLTSRVFAAMTGEFGITREMMLRRPWEAMREAMEADLSDVRWVERYFGFAFVASGAR